MIGAFRELSRRDEKDIETIRDYRVPGEQTQPKKETSNCEAISKLN